MDFTGRNIKLHAVCDDKGRPLVLLLTPGNVHDCKVAKQSIEALPPANQLVADKGYDSNALREWLAEWVTKAVIPPRSNRKVQYDYNKTLYKQRNIIERMFCRLKDWRRIATRFDRNIKNFLICHHPRRCRHMVDLMSPDPNQSTPFFN